VRLAREAEKQLRKLPPDRQVLITKHLREMREDPFRGDVKALQGKEWKGKYRKVSGRYRIIFALQHQERVVEVWLILLRNEKTYQ
jgi:mRNA-degrading endonuclease RelE of RelBE toxin-antitoxin system